MINKFNRRYCMFCKKVISRDMEICPECGKRQDELKYAHEIKCTYCNIDVPAEARYCRYCGTKIVSLNTIEESIYELRTSIIYKGGNAFEINQLVHVFMKNGKISFKTFGFGSYSFDIKKDFLMCEKLQDSKKKILNLDLKQSYVSLTFNDLIFIIIDDYNTNDILVKIYNNLVNSIYETENIFYNADHERFKIF